MKRALSLVLGLLVLLTAFSGLTSAVYSQIEHFDDTNFSFSRLMGDNIYTVRDFKILPETMQVEVFEIYFKSFDKPSYGAVLWYFREGSGDFYGIFLGGSDSSITLSSLPSPLRFSRQDYGSVPFPTDGSEVVIRLKWDDTIGAYKLQLLDVVSGELQLIAEANTTLTTLLSATEWGIANDLYAQATPTYSVSNSILTYTIGDIYSAQVDYVRIDLTERQVKFNIKDALTGQSLTGVTVKEGNTILGTINDGDYLSLLPGDYILTFEKSSYWSVTKTVNVQSDTSVSVEMYPNTAAVKFTNVPENLTFYAGTINTVSFTIEPIQESVAKNAYISFSGITPLNVRINGQVVTPENNKYYVGDVQGPVSVSVDFEVSEAIGTKSFSATVLSYDLLGNSYTATKTITYDVQALPFIIEWPTWQIGDNTLRIVEQSGDSYLVSVSLLDANGTEVYSDSYVFGPYESHDFVISLDKAEGYTLRITWNNNVLERTISATYPIELLTKSITAGEGDIATVSLKIRNVADVTYYYNITLDGPIFSTPVTKSVSVAPNSEKTVYIDFRVPENLEFDAYTLNVQVETNGQAVFTDTVTLTIDNTGFSLGSLDLGGLGDYWVYIIGALVVLGILLFLKR